MITNMGLLLTLTEPPVGMEEEFNAWYDTEHMSERLSIPGFISARRWERDCKPGEGRYLATYELTSPGVLESPDYLAHVGDNQTPWSKRCLGRSTVFRRWACEQTVPGNRLPDEAKMQLLKEPRRPRWRPFIHLTYSSSVHETWRHFVDVGCWSVELGD